MREMRRWRVRSATIRWLILIFLLMEFMLVTSATKSRHSERWQRFKRQHYRPGTNGGVHNNHNDFRSDERHLYSANIPQNVVLGNESLSRQVATAGRWSVWSESSPCSRTCGGGVATQTRTCHDFRSDGVPLCIGPNKKFLSCNVQDCPEGSLDFRAEQCSRFNNVPFDGRYYDWIPYTKAPNKCELNCMPKGENVYYRHARRVVDGTTCDPDTLDICVEGNCLPVGCDKILGSSAKEDKCRVCGGDGSTCQTIEGVVDLSNLQTGYNDILIIPVGSTNVIIQQKQPTNNYLAIRNLTNHYYLNGNWRIDFPRDLKFAGTTFIYERRPHAFTAPESIKAIGPTTEVIYIVLLYQEQNLGVHYEYSIPFASAPKKHETYNWVYGSYGECSAECAGGHQIRNVSCAKQSNFETVADYLCDPHLKPQSNRTCNTQHCSASWHTGKWQNCSALCGKGVEYRTIYCYRLSSGDVPIVVDDADCETDSEAGAKPDNLRPCASDLSCPAWSHSQWSPCDALCGAGEQTRSVTCQRNNSGTIEIFPDKACLQDHPEKPTDKKKCDAGPCEGLDWIVSEWTGCNSCDQTVESRQALCSSQSGTVYPDEACSGNRLPETSQICKDTLPCEYKWYATQWSDCSAKCGAGIKTRRVFCGSEDNSTVTEVDEELCEIEKKYADREECVGKICEANWFTGPWNRCTAPCGGGHRTRKVLCLQDSKMVNSSHCDASKKHLYREPCSTQPCDEDEILTVGGCKASKHGCCPDGVTSAGSNYEGCPPIEHTDTCEKSEFGCCTDGVTHALGPFRKGCPKVYRCGEAKFKCCPDGITPAKGPDGEGCLEPEFCASSRFGCCPDEVTPKTGPKFEGCDVIITEKCLNTAYGCCPDGITAAEGSGAEGCTAEVEPDFKDLEDGSGVNCADSTYGCCQDNLTTALGAEFEGCDGFNIATENVTTTTEESPFEFDCENTTYGCCPDQITVATGPNNEGCEAMTTEESFTPTPEVSPTESSPTESSPTELASTPEIETSQTVTPDGRDVEPLCSNTPFGCCPDGFSEATGPGNEGCPSCKNSSYGCCLDGETAALGPNYEGCELCATSEFGCCPNLQTLAKGPDYQGCGCETYSFGCCPDGSTIATGENGEGCGCTVSTFGCCQDHTTPAQGPNYEGCGCETFVHKCCPDGRTPAQGPHYAGCGCEAWYFGCCPDGRTAARGPNNEGCGCEASRFGCCPDAVTFAQGPNNDGCAPEKQKKAGDVCGLAKERGECRNFTVKWFFDMEYGGCSRFWYGGCDGNDNRFDSQEECQQVCVAPEGIDACLLPKVVGPCDGSVPSFYYNTKTSKCEQFHYSGCLGNNNRFPTQEECEQTCRQPQTKDPCKQPRVEGPCRGYFPRWYYDNEEATCKDFVYGGCKGNDNNFETASACLQQCSVRTEKEDICQLKRAEGPCRDYQIKWYFDQDAQQCGQFYYGGCEGNENRFDTEEACRSKCTEPPKHEIDICKLPSEIGNCADYQERWFYDNAVGSCRGFIYGGCNGNENNFGSEKECDDRCGAKPTPKPDSTITEKPEVTDKGVEVVADDFLLEYCHLDYEAGPCHDNVPRWFYDKNDGVCKHFYYGGCQGNGNRFVTKQECENRCSSSQDICTLPRVHGPCSGAFRQWFYNKDTSTCEEFRYGGCEGNGNRFDSVEECENRCAAQPTTIVNVTTTTPPITDVCQLPSQPGPCLAQFPRWYYDSTYGRCLSFIYGGCEGNDNRYESEESCERSCGQYKGQEVCTQTVDPGPCIDYAAKWHFDWNDHNCKPFYYGGCDGNGNRFASSTECEQICLPTPRKPVEEISTTTAASATSAEPEPPADICQMPADPGPCNELQPHWYYYQPSSSCLPFTFGGCGGNLNRFATYRECMEACHPQQRVCPDPTECYTLQCAYGIEQYRDENLCPHCRCTDPCENHVCPPGSRCIVEQDVGEDDTPRLQAVCRNGIRDGACPHVPVNSTGRCNDECSSDADCYGETKCCFNGCGFSCIEALAATAPEVPTPSPPSAVVIDEPKHKEEQPSVAYAPHILDSEPEIVTSSGSLATLPCSVSGEPQPSVEWRKATGESLDLLADSSRYRRLVDGSLQIVEVQPSDAGNYVCTATNPSGTAEKLMKLIIQDPVPAPAQIIGGVKVVQAPLHEPCMLHCNAQGWPRPSVTWWRESLMLPRSSERYHQYNNYTLLIRQIAMADIGPYECRAYNGIGDVAIWEVTVYLDGPPILDTSDAKLKYFGPETHGQHTIPSPTPTLQLSHENNAHQHNHHKNNNLQNDPSFGVSSNFHYNNNNNHTNSNGETSTTSTTTTSETYNVHENQPENPTNEEHRVDTPISSPTPDLPTAVIHRNMTSFAPDSVVQLDCETTNSQRTLWYKSDNLVHSDERILVFANGTLLIKKALPMDSGTYKCEAANFYGETHATISITIEGFGIPDDCVDNTLFANCALIVKAKYCNNKWYSRFCCRSCALDGQINPARMSGDVKDNLVA
ncbi:hypothetical protein CHUAL_009835 [Chamberlinius hualienensis]